MLAGAAGRPLAVPKDVPQDRLEALRAAFLKTMADPEFVATMTSQGFPIDPIDGGIPRSANAVENASAVYCDPASE